MKISAITPVLNECEFIGYCIMAALDQMHEFIYALDEKSDDGTRELLRHIKDKYAHEKLTVIETPSFHPTDMEKYNASFNACIAKATGDAVMFLHPDMIIKNPEQILSIDEKPMAWTVHMTSYAKDFRTVYTAGRCDRWKNIHKRKFGLHYYGAYGGNIEDFYHKDITGKSYKHFQTDFKRYPFAVGDSGLRINHYCEMKGYKRRLEKMTWSLMAQNPGASKEWIEENAVQHPRVTLENSASKFGVFETGETQEPIPPVFDLYREEFDQFKREKVIA